MKAEPALYKLEMQTELAGILGYWARNAPDLEHGGFYGRRDENNLLYPETPKGIVLNSRILWSFSAACEKTANPEWLELSRRAYAYILDHFTDRVYGGVYWTVDYRGAPLNGRKQIYGLAFTLYAFAAYYRLEGDPEILENAKSLFRLIEQYAYDRQRKGYYEAFGRDWRPETDFRLSEKDANEQKTMNTHLHLLEAYTRLYRVWPDGFLKKQIENLLEVFKNYIIDRNSGHLILFFDENWNYKSGIVSYGHDIEASWLLQEAAEMIHTGDEYARWKEICLKIAMASLGGLDTDGGLFYEYEPGRDLLIREKHWWPQAEAMVGFLNAWQLSGETRFFELSYGSWQFIKNHIKDYRYGEWRWGVDADNQPMKNQDKLGFWKCPYHNTRACLETLKRLSDPFFPDRSKSPLSM